MGYESVKVKDIVKRSVGHEWSIPEFQRGFVWKTTQVRDLAESLWLNYPVGTLLIWDSSAGAETKGATDSQSPTSWVVDGQQRTTALCILSGRKPYWWQTGKPWDDLLRKYDIRFDIHTTKPPFFVVANAATRKVATKRYIPVRDLLNLDTDVEKDQKALLDLARQVKLDGLCDGLDVTEVYTRLDRLRKIRDKDVVLITVDNDLEDVVEIFARLNSRGTRVTEADIYLGVVAARTPGWVRQHYLPYIESLGESGFDVTPNLVFRTLTGIGKKRVRYRDIDSDFWNETYILPTWERTKKAWSLTVKHLRDRGISGNALLPSDNALVPLTALLDRFPEATFDQVFYWLLQASRFGRYSTSSTSSMEEDLKEIADASDIKDALERLLARIRYLPALTADDFLRDYSDARFGRLLLYVLIYNAGAIDWDKPHMKIGFDSGDLVAGLTPQFHHVFPKAFIGDSHPESLVNALANIALIGPKANIRISKNNPMDYVGKYNIGDSQLSQQFIEPTLSSTSVAEFPKWVQTRAERLAKAGNELLAALRGDLKIPEPLASEASSEHAFSAE
ncbi:DUF262 domain-containing protein [Mesorhizobium sp. CAU 1741]|uniref:GmrSD restriction endonuclease domain-containing protein n=1 Tax=Mesorhizobium sp. CAU 1741 TaxID=3140366 RepID=UPI00325B0C28